MKKITIFFIIVIITVVAISYMFINYKNNQSEIKKENKIYEEYLNKEKIGTEVATIINKAMDSNYKNDVEKDNDGNYINNENNSINIDFKMLDNDKTYRMEAIFKGGISNFTDYYRDIKFKCMKIEYHKTGRIKYMLFEQITK